MAKDAQINIQPKAEDWAKPATLLDLDDPYNHSPPKLNGDPWEVLLKPELEADKMRCDAWKEEVQTLLIFAGLFSAVVTAFVVESYKFLQPDPNDAIIDLLFSIASSLNGSSQFPPSVNISMRTTSPIRVPSSVRINVFWFLSLILSLTTVLVGTIGLQWLRAHQSYPEYSAKEILAILRMRSQAIETWYVSHFFAALPLLLQGALVLFFAGLIDFAILLGMKVTIPVALIIGLTLLFLAATTILPTLQTLFFLTGLYPRKSIPTPCAFKSPQAHAFRNLCLACFHFLALGLSRPTLSKYLFQNPFTSKQSHLYPYIYTIWSKNNWPAIDREWLPLRDACHQRILDDDPDLYRHRKFWERTFPLSDITQCVFEAIKEAPSAKHSGDFLIAAYHCFQEITSNVWTNSWSFPERIDRRNNYFEQLQGDWGISSTSKFLVHGGLYKFKSFSDDTTHLDNYIGQHSSLFRQEQAFLFLDMLLERHKSPVLGLHRIELWSRLMQYMLRGRISPLTPSNYNSSALTLFDIYPFDRSAESVVRADVVDLLTTIFDSAAASSHILDDQLTNFLYTHRQIPHLLHNLAFGTVVHLRLAKNASTMSNSQKLQNIDRQYGTTFKFVADYLNKEMLSPSSNPQGNTHILLFYLSSIFAQKLLEFSEVREVSDRDNDFSEGFCLLFSTLRRYKSWSSSPRNFLIEIQFNDVDYFERKADLIARFSDEWWDALLNDPNDVGPCTTEQTKAVVSSSAATYGPEDLKPLPLCSVGRQSPLSQLESPLSGSSVPLDKVVIVSSGFRQAGLEPRVTTPAIPELPSNDKAGMDDSILMTKPGLQRTEGMLKNAS